jgi:hypothetical protein
VASVGLAYYSYVQSDKEGGICSCQNTLSCTAVNTKLPSLVIVPIDGRVFHPGGEQGLHSETKHFSFDTTWTIIYLSRVSASCTQSHLNLKEPRSSLKTGLW